MLHRFPLRHRRVPNNPAGLVFSDVGGGAAFEDTVVPLTQVLFDLRPILVARDAAGFPGTLEGAGKHEAALTLCEVVVDFRCRLLSALGEREVGSAGMGAGKA